MPQSLADTIRNANQVILVEGTLAALADFFTEEFVAHGTDADLEGITGLRRFVDSLQQAFSERRVEVEILVESADRVAWQRTIRAVHSGSFTGFPATGRQVVWRDMVVSRFDGGKIAEDWVVTDLAERLLRARGG